MHFTGGGATASRPVTSEICLSTHCGPSLLNLSPVNPARGATAADAENLFPDADGTVISALKRIGPPVRPILKHSIAFHAEPAAERPTILWKSPDATRLENSIPN